MVIRCAVFVAIDNWIWLLLSRLEADRWNEMLAAGAMTDIRGRAATTGM